MKYNSSYIGYTYENSTSFSISLIKKQQYVCVFHWENITTINQLKKLPLYLPIFDTPFSWNKIIISWNKNQKMIEGVELVFYDHPVTVLWFSSA